MRIRVITCGGTIDKVYFDAMSEYQVGETNIGGVFAQIGLGVDHAVTSVMRKDSLDMTDTDRQAVRRAVEACDESYVLVTHGTDTMVDTARALVGIASKRVVLTGAMQPAAMRDSDAVFNIGFAMGVLVSAPADPASVMIAMNGRAFDPHHVRKNRSEGRFESTAD